MNRRTQRSCASGFALTEAMVALLLLAIALLGAGAAVIQSVAGQRAALLQTRAADLAGNLAEALRGAPDADAAMAEIHAWQALASRLLPSAEPSAQSAAQSAAVPGAPPMLPARFEIHLRWKSGARTPSQLMLPLAQGMAAGSP